MELETVEKMVIIRALYEHKVASVRRARAQGPPLSDLESDMRKSTNGLITKVAHSMPTDAVVQVFGTLTAEVAIRLDKSIGQFIAN